MEPVKSHAAPCELCRARIPPRTVLGLSGRHRPRARSPPRPRFLGPAPSCFEAGKARKSRLRAQKAPKLKKGGGLLEKGGAEKLSGMAPGKNGGGEKPEGGTPMKKGGAEKRKGGYPAEKGAAPGQKGGAHLKNGGHPAEKGDAPFFQSAGPRNPRSTQKITPPLHLDFRASAPFHEFPFQQIAQGKIKNFLGQIPRFIQVICRGVHWP